jgi:hypothetical protein
MAVDREKLQEESPVLRFYRIVLGWDYFRLLKNSFVIPLFLSLSLVVCG